MGKLLILTKYVFLIYGSDIMKREGMFMLLIITGALKEHANFG